MARNISISTARVTSTFFRLLTLATRVLRPERRLPQICCCWCSQKSSRDYSRRNTTALDRTTRKQPFRTSGLSRIARFPRKLKRLAWPATRISTTQRPVTATVKLAIRNLEIHNGYGPQRFELLEQYGRNGQHEHVHGLHNRPLDTTLLLTMDAHEYWSIRWHLHISHRPRNNQSMSPRLETCPGTQMARQGHQPKIYHDRWRDALGRRETDPSSRREECRSHSNYQWPERECTRCA